MCACACACENDPQPSVCVRACVAGRVTAASEGCKLSSAVGRDEGVDRDVTPAAGPHPGLNEEVHTDEEVNTHMSHVHRDARG